MNVSKDPIVEETERWILSFIVKLNICPFAKREVERDTVKIQVAQAKKISDALEELLMALLYLDTNPTIETTLLVFPNLFKDFFKYLDFVDCAECLISEQGYEGIYQLASFHPDYCFANTCFDDVSNYTNRSPYPMIHILREAGLEKAIAYYGDTEQIPTNNIVTMKKLGLEKIQALLRRIKAK